MSPPFCDGVQQEVFTALIMFLRIAWKNARRSSRSSWLLLTSMNNIWTVVVGSGMLKVDGRQALQAPYVTLARYNNPIWTVWRSDIQGTRCN